jgi:hypothetical protein
VFENEHFSSDPPAVSQFKEEFRANSYKLMGALFGIFPIYGAT